MQAGNPPGIDKEEMRRSGVTFTECAHIVPESTYFDSSMVMSSPEKVRP
jgi:hypothetical protein